MNTQIITFQADEQCLVKTGGIDKYASDTVSYIEAQFTLGENWSGYDQISAIWQSRYGTKRSVLDTEGVCLVPWEMLTKRSDLLVNLVGSIADNDVLTDRLTTFAIKALEISQDVPIDADAPTPITPSEYEQFVATVAADADRAEAAKLDARESAEEAEQASQSVLGLTATASVDSSVGTPSVAVTVETVGDHKVMDFDFHNLKGEQGIQGEQGERGETGQSGADGFSPIVEVYQTEDGHEVSITDAEGTQTFEVLNGNIEDFYPFLPTDTAQGEIASFTDGANDVPVTDLLVNITPKQDLHGQTSPYPAGGGKNKFPDQNKEVTHNGTTAVFSGGTVRLTGTATDSGGRNVIRSDYLTLKTGTYYFKRFNESSGSGASPNVFLQNGETIIYPNSATGSFTLAEDSDQINIGFNVITNSVYNYTVTLMIATEDATSYSPYSNICPITGHSEVEVWRAGANFLNVTEYGGAFYSATVGTSLANEYAITATQTDDGYDVVVPTSWWGKVFATDVLPSGTYNFHVRTTSNDIRAAIFTTDRDYVVTSVIGYVTAGTYNAQITLTGRGRIAIFVSASGPQTMSVHDFQVEYGNSFTAYEPHNIVNITVPLGQTVYGGTLDVTTGVLTVDRAMVDLGSLSWNYYDNTFFTDSLTNKKVVSDYIVESLLCSQYPTVDNSYTTSTMPDPSIKGQTNSVRVLVKDTSYTSASAFKTAMNGVQLCYELATPITYQLTPTEVRTLLGDNNIWADTGASEVTYRADIQKYIDKQISAVLNA